MRSQDPKTRKDRILELIIDSYIDTAAPVGSKAVSERFEEELSSATVRSIMSELEESGYLTHPHTSAGRIPTDKGYRFYVDRVVLALRPEKDETQKIEKQIEADEKQELLRKVLKALAAMTGQASFVLYPDLKKSSLMYVELFPVYANKILLLLVTMQGLIKNTIVDLGYKVDEDLLERVSDFLNMQFRGKGLNSILPEIKDNIDRCDDSFLKVLELSMGILEASEVLIEDESVNFEGASNILRQPEFEDTQKAQNIMEILEDRIDIASMIKQDIQDAGHIVVHIGSENKNKKLRDCSIVISPYMFGQRAAGAVGVLGPTRMQYKKIVAKVELLSDILGRLLNE